MSDSVNEKADVDYYVWTCCIIVPATAKLPAGFDAPPREAATKAIAAHIPIIDCFSGWGGTLTSAQHQLVTHTMEGRDKNFLFHGEDDLIAAVHGRELVEDMNDRVCAIEALEEEALSMEEETHG